VTSVPAGATVWADDRELGTTPLEGELDAGRYTLAIVHPQFRRFESPLTVVAGQPIKVGPVELGMPDGRLVVASRPAGADVSIGGRYRGRTPLSVAVPPGMPQEVLLTLAGHAPASQTVSVESRAERRLSVELRAILGEVRVKGEPADAILFVDGASRGPANQTLSLPAAPHVIEVRKGGLETFRATVTPQEGRTQVVEFTLKTAGEARVAGMAAQQATSLGQPLVLVKGGRFTMGSARREPGRRSNETERQVELRRPFYIARFQVTNREFREFRAQHLSGIFKDESLDLERQPVVRVTWQDAAAFCNWLSERDKLPPAYVRRSDKLNGKTRHDSTAAGPSGSIHGATTCLFRRRRGTGATPRRSISRRSRFPATTTAIASRRRWAATLRAPSACTTWVPTCSSGRQIAIRSMSSVPITSPSIRWAPRPVTIT
jgi:hypothetical protein